MKGAHKSKAQKASGAKNALVRCSADCSVVGKEVRKTQAMKKAGKGIFAPKTLSAELSAVCGGKKVLPRTEVRAGAAGVRLRLSAKCSRKHGRVFHGYLMNWCRGHEGHLGVHQGPQNK